MPALSGLFCGQKMQFLIRTTVLLFALHALPVFAQFYDTKRIGQCDVYCLDDQRSFLSCHQREGTARKACEKWSIDNGLKPFHIQGGLYEFIPTALAQSYPGSNNSTGGTESPPPNQPAVWNSTPSPGFVLGTAATYDMAGECSDPEDDAVTIALNTGSASLPTDVTIVDLTFSYAGGGTAGTTTDIILDCDDGINDPAVSESVSITITDPGSGLAANTPSYISVLPGQDFAHPAACFGCDENDWPATGWSWYTVTNTGNGTGAGTLRGGLQASGCRYIIFETSGDWDISTGVETPVGCFVLAGSTSPAPGVAIYGLPLRFLSGADNVLIEGITFAEKGHERGGSQVDQIQVGQSSGSVNNVIVVGNFLCCSADSVTDIIFAANNISLLQNYIAWPLLGEPTNTWAFGTLAAKGVSGVLISRNVYANLKQRAPLAGSNGGTFADNVVYNWTHAASQMFTNASFPGHWNFIGNTYVIGPNNVNSECLRIKDAPDASYWFDDSGAGNNGGLNGMPTPCTINSGSNNATAEGGIITAHYPSGLVINGSGTTSSARIAHVQKINDCAGPDPENRFAPVSTLATQVETRSGGSIINSPTEIGFPVDLAENTVSHSGKPSDPNVAGDPVNAGWQWIMEQRAAKLPAGKGCY